MRACLLFLLFVFTTTTAAADRQEDWLSVTLDGRKIGHMHNVRELRDGRVSTTQTMEVRLDRAGIGIGIVTSETSVESTDGKPLGFSANSKLSGLETSITGTLDGDTLSVTTTVGGVSSTKTRGWPQGALLAEGLRLAAQRQGLKPGTTYTDLAFQPSSLDAFKVTTRVVGTEIVDLPGGRRALFRMDQDVAIPGMPTQSHAYVDAKQEIHKLVLSVLGQNLELINCGRSCAEAPNQSAELLQQALLAAPASLQAEALKGGLRYTLSPRNAAVDIDVPTTNEQHARREAGAILLDVRAQAIAGGKDLPVPADSAASAWLQSGAPEIVKLARQATSNARGDLQRMQQLESFVRGYIKDKNLSVGYASALEVAKTREGDCTEHAVLLAALGRALSIPTRVANGLAYTASFGGAERVFVPHAWTQAWVNGRWQSFDAALNGFDAGHITLGVGDGDPWRFFSGISTLGNLKLDKVETLPPP